MLLEVDALEKRYPRPGGEIWETVLRGVALRLDAGETLAVMGPSGSGKSTLLNIVGALDSATGGCVRLAGRDYAGMNEKGRARLRNREIGFVFQMHHLLPQCTVLENVLLPTLPLAAEVSAAQAGNRARELLAFVGLEDRMHAFPGRLSAGQCQRAAAVRALINRPRLVLADEPTGALDRAAADRLADLLLQLQERDGSALLTATHSPELAGRMQRRCLLRDGRLQEAG